MTTFPGVAQLPGSSQAAKVTASHLWDPDGAGAAPARLVLGGSFAIAGDQLVGNVACFDPQSATWSTFGCGTNGEVTCFATLANGDLAVGGAFTTAGGVTVNRIARWNGSTWSNLGSGMNATVNATAVMPNGDLIAGGQFVSAGGTAAAFIARWDGTGWSALGSGMNNHVSSLEVLTNGTLLAGGHFTTADGAAAVGIAAWGGSSWTPMPGLTGSVNDLLQLPSGEVIAAGVLTSNLGAVGTASWNGSTWSAMPGFVQFGGPFLYTLALRANGELYVGGYWGLVGAVLRRWDGASWVDVSPSLGTQATVHAMTVLPDDDLVVAGSFNSAVVPSSNVARWDGNAFSPLAPGIANPGTSGAQVRAMVELANGDVIVAGQFDGLSTPPAHNVARWSSGAWTRLGSGLGTVQALSTLANGDLVASSHGLGVQRWDGAAWSQLGTGLTGNPTALVKLPNGDLIAGGTLSLTGIGSVGVARWNGSAWSPLGLPNGLGSTQVHALIVLPNGHIVAGTGSNGFGNSVLLWNGLFWSALGTGITGTVQALALMPNGDVLAGGYAVNSIQRWDGSQWTTFATVSPAFGGTVTAIQVLHDDSLLVGGSFTAIDSVAATALARWDAGVWQALPVGGPIVNDLLLTSDGAVLVGGSFVVAGGVVSPAVARYESTCPAGAVSSGAGCTGTGGPNVLTSEVLPWIGATARARGTGLGAQSIALGVLGFASAAVPLDLIFPQAGSGCWLLVTPDVLATSLPVAGSATIDLPIPYSTALVGLSVFAQMAALEFDGGGALQSITSTNRVVWTVGTF